MKEHLRNIQGKNYLKDVQIAFQAKWFVKMAWFINIATLGPTWEFQPCLKSCNLASSTTKWHDYARGTGHPPTCPRPSWKWNFHAIQEAKIWGMSQGCVEGAQKVSVGRLWGIEGVWRVLRRCRRTFKIYFNPNIFGALNFLDTKFLWAQIFWFQYFLGPGKSGQFK